MNSLNRLYIFILLPILITTIYISEVQSEIRAPAIEIQLNGGLSTLAENSPKPYYYGAGLSYLPIMNLSLGFEVNFGNDIDTKTFSGLSTMKYYFDQGLIFIPFIKLSAGTEWIEIKEKEGHQIWQSGFGGGLDFFISELAFLSLSSMYNILESPGENHIVFMSSLKFRLPK